MNQTGKDASGSPSQNEAVPRQFVWRTIIGGCLVGLMILNTAVWHQERTADREYKAARQERQQKIRLLVETESRVRNFEQTRVEMFQKQNEIWRLLRSVRRPSMVAAIQSGLTDLEFSEVIVVRTSSDPVHGASFAVWSPVAGQSLSIVLHIAAVVDTTRETEFVDDESHQPIDVSITEPLQAKQLHFVRYEFDRRNGVLQVSVDDRLIHERELEGFRVNGSSSITENYKHILSEPNFVATDDIGTELSLRVIAEGCWLPIHEKTYELRHSDGKQATKMNVQCTLRSSGPFYVDRKAALTRGWGRVFDVNRYLDLRDTKRGNVQQIIAVKEQ